jgi:hypothetical protein
MQPLDPMHRLTMDRAAHDCCTAHLARSGTECNEDSESIHSGRGTAVFGLRRAFEGRT